MPLLCHLQVLSPLPTFINDGRYRAWADAGGSPLIYVMRCNPQHYYLTHEIGHRLGMPHATLYKLTEEKATAAVSMKDIRYCICGTKIRAGVFGTVSVSS
jgi:hypothetical protein